MDRSLMFSPEAALDLPVSWRPYIDAAAVWLEGYPVNTRKTYNAAFSQFFSFVEGKLPADVRPLDLARWKEALKERGLSDATVHQRLSALSSYFLHLTQTQPEPLLPFNPVQNLNRRDLAVSGYERSRKLSPPDFVKILRTIDTETVSGARDFAMLLFYVLCGRRRSEVVNLRFEDLRFFNGDVTYRVRTKGGAVSWKELPGIVWQAIEHYLDLAGRTLAPGDPVFLATTDRGKYKRRALGLPEPETPQPLSGHAINHALKRHAKRAGLDPATVSLHSLRHLAAALFHAQAQDVRETQNFLGHKHSATTEIYLEQLSGAGHPYWREMAAALGLGDD